METKKAVEEKRGISFISKYSQKTWIYTVALAVICIVIFSGFIFSDRMLFSSDQLGGLDSKVFMRTALVHHHQFPLWFNPRLGGMPTIDALFGDALYLPSIVFSALFPVPRAIGLKMILHIFLAGFFFFLMLRRGFKVGAPLAFIGGVFYMLNPEFFSHIYPGHDGKMYVIAWLPFIVWRLKALADVPTLRNATFLGLGIGISLLTSHVQMTYFILWGLFAYTAIAVARAVAVQHEKRRALRLGMLFCIAVAIGLGIGFIQLFPSLMYIRDAFSVRGVDRGFDYAASWSLHWPEFFSLWVPEFGNTLDYYWGGNAFKLNSEYAGGIVLLLAALAVAWKPRPWRWFWAGVAVFAVLYSLGAHTPVFHIAYAIVPGVKKFRACSMIMFWFSFSTILLSLLLLKDMLSGELSGVEGKHKGKLTKRLFIVLGVIAVLAVIFSMKDMLVGFFPFIAELDTKKRQVFEANFSRNFVPMLWLWFFFAAIAAGLIIAVLNKKIKPAAAIGVIFAMGCIDVLRVDTQFIKLINPQPYFYAEPALQNIRNEMARAPFRVFSLPGALPQNGEGIHGLEGVGGFHDNELHWYRTFRGDQQDRNYFDKLVGFTPKGEAYLKAEQINQGNAFLDIANVKYLLVRNGEELLALENRNALGRVSFAPNFIIMDSSRIVPALQSGGYDYRTTVALLADPMRKPPAPTPDSLANAVAALFSAQWQRYSPNDRIVRVTVPLDGFLRISEVYYPGWKILIDGKPASVNRSDLAWMAVFLPKGEHVVEMSAHSLYLAKAELVTFPLLAFLCLYWCTIGLLRKRKNGSGG